MFYSIAESFPELWAVLELFPEVIGTVHQSITESYVETNNHSH